MSTQPSPKPAPKKQAEAKQASPKLVTTLDPQQGNVRPPSGWNTITM